MSTEDSFRLHFMKKKTVGNFESHKTKVVHYNITF